MKRWKYRWIVAAVLGALFIFWYWQHEIGSVRHRSFDELRRRLEGKSAAETVELLGEPDTRQEVFGGDMRFIWWRRAVLDGPNYAPEVRGRVVHVQIVFRNPGARAAGASYASWQMDEGLGIGFWLPGESESASSEIRAKSGQSAEKGFR